MSPRETLERFSALLLREENVLSARERELLRKILQKLENDGDEHVRKGIARAIGEVVMERASMVLGDSILRQIEQTPLASPPETLRSFEVAERLDLQTEAERLGPRPPGPNPPPRTPIPAPTPMREEPGPRPPGPNPPGGPSITARATRQTASQATSTAVLEKPEFLRAECVVLDEFLAPGELKALSEYVLEHEKDFACSEVVSPGAPEGKVEFDHRRSRVLMDLGPHHDVILKRLEACLPEVLKKLGRDPFPLSRVEAQITASNDGDFFHWHTDNGQEEVSTREITFVYFFHREPRPFRGGELRLYDSQLKGGGYVPTSQHRAIVPEQNQMVLFVSSLAHEITPVESPGGGFSDSRFTVNGWLSH